MNLAYPKELKTIGDHLRACRLDRGLSQPQVAEILKVSTETVTNWELNHFEPQVRHMATVLSFLGYDPFGLDMSKLGSRIYWFRLQHGLQRKELSKRIGVDEQTITRVEQGQRCFRKTIIKVEAYFRNLEKTLATNID